MDRRQLVIGATAAALWTPATGALAADKALEAAVKSASRTPANVARDPFRHPVESLTFWGLKPGMTVVEIDPGKAGYWKEILEPYLAATKGKYIAASAPYFAPAGQVTAFGVNSPPIGPEGSADLVLTARNIHNFMWEAGLLEKAMKDFHHVLKKKGILAIEEHRADPKPQVDTGPRRASNGYVAVANVVEAATKAGFKLDAKSEINANPKDTKDHPFGVWTLPPTLQAPRSGQAPPPGYDKAKFAAIGESDRMTLRFRKG